MISLWIRRLNGFGTVGLLFVAVLLGSGAGASALAAQEPSAPSPPHAVQGYVSPFTSGAWLGVELKDVTAALAHSMKLPGEYGAIVVKVEPDSPASKAGLEVNDVILEFGSWKVWSAAQLAQLLRETPPGRTVDLRVSRAGKMRNLHATLAARSEHAFMPQFTPPRIHIPPRNFHFRVPRNYNFHFDLAGPVLGITGQTLTPQLAAFFGVKQGSGVLVDSVDKDSPAAKAGLEAGDCIVKVGSAVVASVGDLRSAIDNTTGSQVTLSVVRAKQERTLTATLEPGWRSKSESRGPMLRDWPGWPGVHGELLVTKAQLAQIRALQRQIERQLPRIKAQTRELNRQLPRMQKEAQAQIDREIPSINNMMMQLQKQAPQLEQQAKQLEQMLRRMAATAGTGAV